MSAFEDFVQEEDACLDELRSLMGAADGSLNGSLDSLHNLDLFVSSLTGQPNWDTSWPFEDFPRARAWLTVRIAYYIGYCARTFYGASWYPCAGPEEQLKGTPVVAVEGLEFSPLEVASALVEKRLSAGLVGFFADLEATCRGRRGPPH